MTVQLAADTFPLAPRSRYGIASREIARMHQMFDGENDGGPAGMRCGRPGSNSTMKYTPFSPLGPNPRQQPNAYGNSAAGIRPRMMSILRMSPGAPGLRS
jgi:hypothetical protein